MRGAVARPCQNEALALACSSAMQLCAACMQAKGQAYGVTCIPSCPQQGCLGRYAIATATEHAKGERRAVTHHTAAWAARPVERVHQTAQHTVCVGQRGGEGGAHQAQEGHRGISVMPPAARP